MFADDQSQRHVIDICVYFISFFISLDSKLDNNAMIWPLEQRIHRLEKELEMTRNLVNYLQQELQKAAVPQEKLNMAKE